jgi:hypothetical protein
MSADAETAGLLGDEESGSGNARRRVAHVARREYAPSSSSVAPAISMPDASDRDRAYAVLVAKEHNKYRKRAFCQGCCGGFTNHEIIMAVVLGLIFLSIAAILWGLFAEGSSIQQTKQQAIYMVKRVNDSGLVDEIFLATKMWQAHNNSALVVALVDRARLAMTNGLTLVDELQATLELIPTSDALNQFNATLTLVRHVLFIADRWMGGNQFVLIDRWLSAAGLPIPP